MLVDANILLYAVDESSLFHSAAREWLEEALNGTRRVGLPWQSLTAFLRIVTNPRALAEPLAPAEAWELVDSWLDAPTTWIPEPGPAHRMILRGLVTDLDLRAGLVSDAVLAALCVEHGLAMVWAFSDFAGFRDLDWLNRVGVCALARAADGCGSTRERVLRPPEDVETCVGIRFVACGRQSPKLHLGDLLPGRYGDFAVEAGVPSGYGHALRDIGGCEAPRSGDPSDVVELAGAAASSGPEGQLQRGAGKTPSSSHGVTNQARESRVRGVHRSPGGHQTYAKHRVGSDCCRRQRVRSASRPADGDHLVDPERHDRLDGARRDVGECGTWKCRHAVVAGAGEAEQPHAGVGHGLSSRSAVGLC